MIFLLVDFTAYVVLYFDTKDHKEAKFYYQLMIKKSSTQKSVLKSFIFLSIFLLEFVKIIIEAGNWHSWGTQPSSTYNGGICVVS